jgi:hypothetical protein
MPNIGRPSWTLDTDGRRNHEKRSRSQQAATSAQDSRGGNGTRNAPVRGTRREPALRVRDASPHCESATRARTASPRHESALRARREPALRVRDKSPHCESSTRIRTASATRICAAGAGREAGRLWLRGVGRGCLEVLRAGIAPAASALSGRRSPAELPERGSRGGIRTRDFRLMRPAVNGQDEVLADGL